MNNLNKLKQSIAKEIGEKDVYRLADVLRVVWIVQPTMKITDKDRIDFGAMVNVTEERAFEVVQEWSLSKNNRFTEQTYNRLFNRLNLQGK